MASNGSGGRAANEENIVRQTTVVGLEAPHLKRIEVPSVAQFLKKRERYEAQILEKNEQGHLLVKAISYKNSVDRVVQNSLWRGTFLNATSVEAITEVQLEKCLEGRAIVEISELCKGEWDRIVKDVKMDMSIKLALNRVWHLAMNYEEKLRAEGYHGVLEICPEAAISHLCDRTKPNTLHNRTEDLIVLQAQGMLHKNDFYKYMEVVVEEAIFVERFERMENSFSHKTKTENRVDAAAPRNRKWKRNDRKRERNGDGTKAGKDSDAAGREPNAKRPFAPECLNKKCSERHWLKDCKNTAKDEKPELIRKHRDERSKTRGDRSKYPRNKGKFDKQSGTVGRHEAEKMDNHSAIFSISVVFGAVESVLKTDQGSDIMAIPQSVLKMIFSTGLDVEEISFSKTRRYNPIVKAKNVEVTCSKKVKFDAILGIRHGWME